MDFKEMTLLQLKAYAKEKGIRGISTLKKEQLVEKLMKSEKYEEKREEKKEENIEVKREENRKENKRANKEEKRKEHRKEHTEESKKENIDIILSRKIILATNKSITIRHDFKDTVCHISTV